LVIRKQSEHFLAENLGILVSDQALLRTHPRIAGVNRALGNGARLHNWNDIDLVLNLIDFTVGDAPHHFREEPHRVYVRRATSIFRERPTEGFLQKLFGFEGAKPRVLSGVFFSDRAQPNPLRIRECADCVGDLVAGSNGHVSLQAPPPRLSSLYADSGMSLGHRP
jgi:hypothetical protein